MALLLLLVIGGGEGTDKLGVTTSLIICGFFIVDLLRLLSIVPPVQTLGVQALVDPPTLLSLVAVS
jgi:hypothetical protein